MDLAEHTILPARTAGARPIGSGITWTAHTNLIRLNNLELTDMTTRNLDSS